MCLGCHVVSVECEIKNINALEKACQRLGWKFLRDQKAYKWYGTWVDDSPVPRHIFDNVHEYNRVCQMPRPDRIKYMNDTLGRCDHAIQIPGAKYEVGVMYVGDHWTLVSDWFGCKATQKALQNPDANPIAQAYAIEATKAQAQYMGHTFTEKTHDNGVVELRMQVSGIQASW